MGVVEVNRATEGWEGQEDWEDNYSYTVRYKVRVSGKDDGPAIVKAASALPNLGDIYVIGNESDAGAYLTQRRVGRLAGESNVYWWLVTDNYANKDREKCLEQAQEDPLKLPPKIRLSFAQFQREMVRDLTGKPIANSAGEFFEPFPTVDDSRPVITVTRNEARDPTRNAIAYQDAVATDRVFGADAGVAKMQSITCEVVYTKDCDPFFSVTYQLQFRREGWRLVLLDQGHSVLVTEELTNEQGEKKNVVKLKVVRDAEDRPLNHPVLLDGSGQLLPPGEEPIPLEFQVLKELPFGPLSLPRTLAG